MANGFRNRDLCAHLYDAAATEVAAARRRCARVSHLIAKLRGHGLLAKVKSFRLYRATDRGYRLMSAALGFRLITFPQAFAASRRHHDWHSARKWGGVIL